MFSASHAMPRRGFEDSAQGFNRLKPWAESSSPFGAGTSGRMNNLTSRSIPDIIAITRPEF